VRDLLQDLRAEQAPGKPVPTSWNRRWVYVIGAVTLVAAGLVIGLRSKPGGVPPLSKGKYIAVLPFAAVGSDASIRLYAQGITDAVAARLFTLEDVHPISQAAVERSNLKQSSDAIARQLGANIVAEGTVATGDGRIVVHSRVMNIGQHKALSENTFTGDASSLLDIENGIYNQIAGAIGAHAIAKPAIENLAAHPTRDPEAYNRYLRGREVLKEKRDAEGGVEAVALFEQACAKDPSFALAWTGVADASLQVYRMKHDSFWATKALDAARRAASDGNDLPEVHFTLGSVYTATGKNAEAVEELKRALALEPNSDNGYLRLGRAYLATGQSEAALSALRKAIDLNPYYWYNHDQLGLAYFRMGRNGEALSEFNNAADLDPSNGNEYNRIGATYWRMGRLQDSIEQFKKVIKLQPSGDAYTNLGTTYFALGRYGEAITNFKKAVQMNAKNISYVANLADAYKQAGQSEEAAKTNGEAIQLAYQQLQVNPEDSATMGYLAMCYARKGDLPKAAEFVRRARGIDPADNQLIYDEAVVDALSGKSQQALDALQQALQKGYSVEEAKADADLKALRPLVEFRKLLERFEGQEETRR
jgi:tetratricopeptide (TPR) repeat protein/TolB-like protein